MTDGLYNDVEGTVEARNDKGIRINGDWFNVSKFRPLELPPTGASVRCTVDPKGFLSKIAVLDAPAAAPGTRSETITRLAVLKAAAYFCGQRATVHEGVKSTDVLAIADAWLHWVNSTPEAF